MQSCAMRSLATPDAGESAWGRLRTRPPGRLGDLATRCAGWWEQSESPVRRLEPPSGAMSLVVSFGPAMRISSASSPRAVRVESFVVGMYDEPALTEHDGEGFGIQLDLTARAAYALGGAPMDELVNRAVPADEACPGLRLGRLVDRLISTREVAERLRIVEEELVAAAAHGPQLSPEVAHVDAALRHEPARSIGELAEEVGWTGSRLVRAFRREIGQPPKTLARVIRARDAVGRLRQSPPPSSLGTLAIECGFSDQAHLGREIRVLTGRTPTEWMPARSA